MSMLHGLSCLLGIFVFTASGVALSIDEPHPIEAAPAEMAPYARPDLTGCAFAVLHQARLPIKGRVWKISGPKVKFPIFLVEDPGFELLKQGFPEERWVAGKSNLVGEVLGPAAILSASSLISGLLALSCQTAAWNSANSFADFFVMQGLSVTFGGLSALFVGAIHLQGMQYWNYTPSRVCLGHRVSREIDKAKTALTLFLAGPVDRKLISFLERERELEVVLVRGGL